MLLPIAEEFDEALKQLPALIKLIEQNSFDSTKKCAGWLDELIILSQKYYLPFSAELAVIKGKLSFYSKPKELDRHEGKRAVSQQLLDCLDGARGLIREHFCKFKQTVSTCEAACIQTASAIWASNMLGESIPDVDMVWQMSEKEPELRKALAQIIGLVGTVNARILLDRMIPQVYTERKE